MGLKERCPECGQVLLPVCADCGVNVRADRDPPSHQADHPVVLGADGSCSICGLQTKARLAGQARRPRIGHIYDHPARLANGVQRGNA